jgi:hypothetical protein
VFRARNGSCNVRIGVRSAGGALFNLAIDGALHPRFSGTFGTG